MVVPSRELARQVGKEWSAFYKGRVATVFGGAPIERHAHLLRGEGGADVVVGTAGRLRELVREGHLSFSRLKVLVLDEADVLLNAKDQPEVAAFLDGMEHDYQLVLCSATVNQHVRSFAKETMEITDSSPNFVTVGIDSTGSSGYIDESAQGDRGQGSTTRAPRVGHWSLPAVTGARCGVAADLIATMHPRTTVVFVPTKVECESAAEELLARLGRGATVHALHGDMPQPARARTISALRAAGKALDRTGDDNCKLSVLVATDVASRGLDLPGVDLVLQFGVPRKDGKDGTFDHELYTHRAGRAGRVGGDATRLAAAVSPAAAYSGAKSHRCVNGGNVPNATSTVWK